MNKPDRHLTGDTFQAYLEGELAEDRTARVEAHVAECPRCASELDGWRLLFSELEAMPALDPSGDFAERVMAGLPRPSSLAGRLADRVRSALSRPLGDVQEHLSPDRIQDLLDGALGVRGRREARGHLEACAPCRSELQEWEGLFATLSSVPTLAPPEGFAARVMEAFEASRVGAPALAPAGTAWLRAWTLRAARAGSRLVPSTGRGWAFLTGLVSLPAVALLAGVAAVMAHPLLTLEGLAVFARWQIAGALHGLASGVLGWILESPALLAAWEAASTVASAPTFAFSGLLALWTLVLVSGWIFYRHVIAPSLMAGHHA